jgi:hypothetical protein
MVTTIRESAFDQKSKFMGWTRCNSAPETRPTFGERSVGSAPAFHLSCEAPGLPFAVVFARIHMENLTCDVTSFGQVDDRIDNVRKIRDLPVRSK